LGVSVYFVYRTTIGRTSWKIRRRIVKLRNAISSVKRRPLVLIAGWLAGTAIQFTLLILAALLAISCGLTLPLRAWLFARPRAHPAGVLPLTHGGIGVREAALVALLAPFGATGSLVVAAGLVWEGVIIAGGLIAGGIALVLKKSQSSSIK